MPWTFSHPAAVLPMRRLGGGRLSFAALVVGSVTPDLGYYLGAHDRFAAAHSVPGLFMVCLPAGLLLYLVLGLLGRPVVQLLPNPHRQALLSLPPQPSPTSLAALCAVVASLLLGSATHLAWDSFTHAYGWPVTHLPLLRVQLLTLDEGSGLPLYKLLQHISTALGAGVLVLTYLRWLKHTLPTLQVPPRTSADQRAERWRLALLAVLLLVSAALGATMAHRGLGADAGRVDLASFIVPWVVESTSFFAIVLTVSALLLVRKSREA